jgi:hypothetical protein
MVFGINTVKGIAIKVYNGLVHINVGSMTITGVGDKLSDGAKVVTKIADASSGASGLAKGSVDVAEALACQDGLCAFVSSVGCAADALQIATSFVPGPNLTALITTPVSVRSKVFVWCCKRSKLPWGSC